MEITPAKRISSIKPYFFADLQKAINQLEKAGVDIIRLDMGSPDLPPADFIIDALIEYGYFSATNEDGTVDQNHESWMPILGIDGIDQAVARMRSGHLYATVLNDAIGQAEATVELAEAILSGEDLARLDQIVDERYVWVDYKKFILNTE